MAMRGNPAFYLFVVALAAASISAPAAPGPAPAAASMAAAQSTSGGVPSIQEIQRLIAGEWELSVGPNPHTVRITDDTVWNSNCWDRYKILDVRPGKIKEHDVFIILIELGPAGGPAECGHGDTPDYRLNLVSADDIRAGRLSGMYWIDCDSKKDIDEALKYPDPRDSDAVCSRYSGRHERTRAKHDLTAPPAPDPGTAPPAPDPGTTSPPPN